MWLDEGTGLLLTVIRPFTFLPSLILTTLSNEHYYFHSAEEDTELRQVKCQLQAAQPVRGSAASRSQQSGYREPDAGGE